MQETVTKLEYDQLVYRHQEELQYIQEEYEWVDLVETWLELSKHLGKTF